MLTKENLEKATALFTRYPEKKAALLPILWIAQEQEGWISTDMMKYIGDLVEVPYAHVLGVVTFYTMYNDKRLGTHHIEVCTNVSCMLRGSDKILDTVEKMCGTKLGTTSPDGKFTISEVECMGACGGAPMLTIGEEYHEHLTAEKTEQLLAQLK
ncbi:MAG: NAD(P)H-dependent oxidoreductase subunit E [Bacteroidetes bacterium]|nr:NAD(P)H-dependent oxidoreductase subunit E [Bacteroidota bacterium]